MNKIFKNRDLQKVILEVAEIADYLWQRGWAERNAGNISVNINDLVVEENKDYKSYPYFKLNVQYPGLAKKYFFVTGTGKRMRDLAREPLQNAILIRINSKGSGYRIISQNKDE